MKTKRRNGRKDEQKSNASKQEEKNNKGYQGEFIMVRKRILIVIGALIVLLGTAGFSKIGFIASVSVILIGLYLLLWGVL